MVFFWILNENCGYSLLALMCYQQRKARFPFTPKGHYLHHQFLTLFLQAKRGEAGLNLLAFANQLSEDFVGRPARISRRVASRTTSLRVIQRIFLMRRNAVLSDADDIQVWNFLGIVECCGRFTWTDVCVYQCMVHLYQCTCRHAIYLYIHVYRHDDYMYMHVKI